MQAFSHISIIKGKPTLSPEGMLSLIWKNNPNAIIDFVTIENEVCIIEAQRTKGKRTTFKFDKEDAIKAGLWNKDNWKQYPRAMCRSRCVAEMARTLFPDAIAGCSYTTEELEPDVVITDEGLYEIKNVQAQPGPKPEPQAEPPHPVLEVNPIYAERHWKRVLTTAKMKGDEPYAEIMKAELEGVALNLESVMKAQHDAINKYTAIIIEAQMLDEHPELAHDETTQE